MTRRQWFAVGAIFLAGLVYAVATIGSAMDRQTWRIECEGVPYELQARPLCVEVRP